MVDRLPTLAIVAACVAVGAITVVTLAIAYHRRSPRGPALLGSAPSTTSSSGTAAATPPPRTDERRPIRDVRIVRLAVLPGQPEHAVVCGEIRLYDALGRWVAPVSGYVRSALPGQSADWRLLTDDDTRTFVHTDDRARAGFTESEAPNVAELHYPPGTEAARLVVWSRPDTLATAADRMTNLEVSVLTPSGAPFRRTLFEGSATPFGATQRYYDFDIRVA